MHSTNLRQEAGGMYPMDVNTSILQVHAVVPLKSKTIDVHVRAFVLSGLYIRVGMWKSNATI